MKMRLSLASSTLQDKDILCTLKRILLYVSFNTSLCLLGHPTVLAHFVLGFTVDEILLPMENPNNSVLWLLKKDILLKMHLNVSSTL